MWQLPSSNNIGTSQTKLHSAVCRYDIHVLLVDHDQDNLVYLVDLLESCSYKVTAVESGRVALSILTKRKKEFDLLLADTNLPDLDVFKLLQVAADMQLPSILMSEDDDKLLAEMAVNNGAILLLQKSFTMETATNFWQLVMRDRTPKTNNLVDQNILAEIIVENERFFPPNIEMAPEMNKRNQTDTAINTNGIVPKKKQRRHSKDEESDNSEHYCRRPNKVKRKVCTEWTEELHARFVNAINHLGDGRCYPKEILDLMDVPGLTRMQVASHLQKCRNDDWRAPHTRRSTHLQSPSSAPILSSQKTSGPNPRKFGSMPRLANKQILANDLGKDLLPHSTGGILTSFAKASSSAANQNKEPMQVTSSPLPEHVPNLPPANFENHDNQPDQLILPNPNPSIQMNMEGPFGAFGAFDSIVPTTDISSLEFGDAAATGGPTPDQFLTAADKPFPDQSYDFPALSDLSFDFLPDIMEGFGNDINGLPEEPLSTYPSSTFQPFVDDLSSIFPDTNSMGTNIDISDPWSFEAANIFNQP